MTIAPLNVGLIGCGNISAVYLNGGSIFPAFKIVACADIEPARAEARAREFGIRAMSVEALLGAPDIDIVLNLTIPKAHADIALAAMRAGKHTYGEKPLAVTREDGKRIVAASGSLRVGCAPDTFLGEGIQTCRKLIDDGAIGRPVAATAFMLNHGHEHWHPDPDFYYQPGGGPLFDMGPYYLTALIALMGPVQRVSGSARTTFATRTVTSSPKHGQVIQVNTPTHLAATLDFANGAVATLVTSFDVWAAEVPRIEIYGSEGTLSMPDPNTFDGPIRLWRADVREWRDVPLIKRTRGNQRGLGLDDMADAIIHARPHRASGALALHVLDIMQAVLESSRDGVRIELSSQVERPASLLA